MLLRLGFVRLGFVCFRLLAHPRLQGNVGEPIEARFAGGSRRGRLSRFFDGRGLHRLGRHGRLGDEALAANRRRDARHGFPAAALIREADEEHARNPDRPRTKQEDRLERGKTRYQRETNSAGATVGCPQHAWIPAKSRSRARTIPARLRECSDIGRQGKAHIGPPANDKPRWIMGISSRARMRRNGPHVCSECEWNGCGRRRRRNPTAPGSKRKAHGARQARGRSLPWAAQGGGVSKRNVPRSGGFAAIP